MWNGVAIGQGVGISNFAPYRIATEASGFSMPECRIGIYTDAGAGYYFSRLKKNIGMYLGLTGRRINSQDIYKAGLANYFIPE